MMRIFRRIHTILIGKYGICDYDVDWKKHDYSWKDFYLASNDSQLDIFLCKENGKLYVPCEHELFQFEEKEHKLPTAKKIKD